MHRNKKKYKSPQFEEGLFFYVLLAASELSTISKHATGHADNTEYDSGGRQSHGQNQFKTLV